MEDTQEQIIEDVFKDLEEYWGCHGYCDNCPVIIDLQTPYERYDVATCADAQMLDLLRRQRELCESTLL